MKATGFVPPPGVALPGPRRQMIRRLRRPSWTPVLRRTRPFSDVWGWDRGRPIDRYYIETFLERHRDSIRGRVLEVGDARYTHHFGTGVTEADVLDISEDNRRATIVADLSDADALAEATFDCIIVVQTLQYVFDLESAVRTLHRALKVGGVLLCTLPSVTRVGSRYLENDFWRFTRASAVRLFGDVFDSGADVTAEGNFATCTAFLAGLAVEEISERKLAVRDPYFPLLITVRATRGGSV
jgi:SAM-dependent methyltransferase